MTASCNQAQLIQTLTQSGAQCIQTSSGLCVRTSQGMRDLRALIGEKGLGDGVTLTQVDPRKKEAEALGKDVIAFMAA